MFNLSTDIKAYVWAIALHKLRGFTETAISNDESGYNFGHMRGPVDVMQIGPLMYKFTQSGSRVAFSAMDDPTVNVGAGKYHGANTGVGLHFVVYAASDTAPLEIMTHGARWLVGPGDVVTYRRLPPAAIRSAGIERAMRRWYAAVEALALSERHRNSSAQITVESSNEMRIALRQAA